MVLTEQDIELFYNSKLNTIIQAILTDNEIDDISEITDIHIGNIIKMADRIYIVTWFCHKKYDSYVSIFYTNDILQFLRNQKYESLYE